MSPIQDASREAAKSLAVPDLIDVLDFVVGCESQITDGPFSMDGSSNPTRLQRSDMLVCNEVSLVEGIRIVICNMDACG